MKKKNPIAPIYITLMLLTMYIPIILVIIYSFNVSKLTSVWEGFTLDWYRELFADDSYLDALINSLILACSSSLAAAVIGTLGAFGLRKVKLKTGGFIEYLSTLPIMIPEIILGLVFMVFFSLIGIPFGMGALIIAHTTFCTPYILMQVKARLSGMDKSIEEASIDLGASRFRTFINIILPNIMPAIASGMLLAFAMSFDDVIISVFVTGVNSNTLPLKIYTQLKTGITPKVNALCTLMFLSTVLLCSLSAYLGRTKKK